MGNITFGSKYFIFSKFSSIPKTSKIENDRANLQNEYQDLNSFKSSKELEDFLELEKYLNSSEHKAIVSSIQNGKKTEQGKVKSFEDQKKSKKFKDYFKFKASQKLKIFLTFSNSDDLRDFENLETSVTSKDFQDKKKSLESQIASEDKKEKEYSNLKKSKAFKSYFRFKNSVKLKEFNTITGSKDLNDYKELDQQINSQEFQQKKNSTDAKEFRNTEEGKKFEQYENLKKSRNIKFYYKFKDSTKYKNYLEFEKSNELKEYLKLEEYLNSGVYNETKSNMKNELAELNSKLKDFQQRKKSKEIKDYFRFRDSQKFKDFQSFEKSQALADYLKLEKYLASSEHKDLLKSLDDKEKIENEKKKQYEEFKNSKKYKWYLGIKDSDKFDELVRWKLVFEDNFKEQNVDPKKWMTRYFWGDKLINDSYALEHDKAFPTDGKNIEITNNILKIVTRKEKTEGKIWKQPFGFMPHEFEYTTGLISTAKSHKQKFGKFEAKIKVNYAKPVNYNFWMASEKNLPHVDILKLEKKKSKIDMAHHIGNITDNKGKETVKAEFSGLDLSQDFFIYTLEWSSDKLTWKINDVVVNEQKKSIPQEEMYLVFSSSITGKVDGSGLPASMEIDWVRCYKS